MCRAKLMMTLLMMALTHGPEGPCDAKQSNFKCKNNAPNECLPRINAIIDLQYKEDYAESQINHFKDNCNHNQRWIISNGTNEYKGAENQTNARRHYFPVKGSFQHLIDLKSLHYK